MKILFTDETNLPTDHRARFFAYGGLIIPIEELPVLHEGIEAIRREAGYRPADELKFQTSSRPHYVSEYAATNAKNAVVELCIKIGCKFIAYVVLHDIAKNINQQELVKRGANHVIGKFNFYLQQSSDFGIVAVDRLPSAVEYSYLADKFINGLTFSDGKPVLLDKIKLFSSTCINASHASSAMDIVLGTFRYCINDPPNVDAAKAMMNNMIRLLWCERNGNEIYAFERGLVLRPKEIKVLKYKAEYDRLIKHINTLIDDVESPSAA